MKMETRKRIILKRDTMKDDNYEKEQTGNWKGNFGK